jgi:exopolysaccharide production protein ExoQ
MRALPVEHIPSWSTAPPRTLGRLLSASWIAGWLFICSGAVFPLWLLGSGSTLSEASSQSLRLLLLPSLMAAPVLLVLRWRLIAGLLRHHPALILLCLWIWLSVAWSVDPSITLRRALSFSANTVIVCWIAINFPPAMIFRLLTVVALVILALSLLFAVAIPELAFMPDTGEFRGVFTHKNGMGLGLVIAVLLTAISWHSRLLPRSALLMSYLAIALLAVPVGSATTLMLMVLLAGLHVPLRIAALPRRMAAGGMLFLLIGSLSILLPLFILRNRIFMALGRDVTLTGRTELWDFIDGFIAQRPITGYGYAAFFEVASVAEQISARIGWGAPNSHNGYREILLGLGLVGLVLALGILLGALWRAVRLIIRDPHDVAGRFAFLFLCLYLLRNFSEADLLAHSDLTWILAGFAVLLPTAAARQVPTLPEQEEP